jgi:hypothetical protein
VEQTNNQAGAAVTNNLAGDTNAPPDAAPTNSDASEKK